MAKKLNKNSKSKPLASKKSLPPKAAGKKVSFRRRLGGWFHKIRQKQKAFLSRRPHRSFLLSHRADYKRSLAIEGYGEFSRLVINNIRRYRKFFGSLLAISVIACVVLVGILPQNSYNNLKEALNETMKDDSIASKNKLFRAGLMFSATVSTGGIDASQTQLGAVLFVFVIIAVWLAVVWFMRMSLAGYDVSVREALYNCCAPIIPMLGVIALAVIQLVPVMIFTIIFAAAKNTNFIGSGVETMVFYAIFGLVIILTSYWLVGSFLALLLVTLPGVYPAEAIKIAGDQVTGRRLLIILRLVWHLFQVALLWVITIFPLILIEDQLSMKFVWLTKVPIIQLTMVVVLMASLIWTFAYIYMLYRRLIEDESKPA